MNNSPSAIVISDISQEITVKSSTTQEQISISGSSGNNDSNHQDGSASILIGVIVIIILGGIGYGGYYLYMNSHKSISNEIDNEIIGGRFMTGE